MGEALYGEDFTVYDDKKHQPEDKAVFDDYLAMDRLFKSLPPKRDTPHIDTPAEKLEKQRIADRKVIMAELAVINTAFRNKKIKEDKLKDAKARRTKVIALIKKYMTKYHKKTFDSKTLKVADAKMSVQYESMEKSYKELSSGGMGWGWWFLIILVIVGIGAALYCFFAGKSDEDEEEMDEL